MRTKAGFVGNFMSTGVTIDKCHILLFIFEELNFTKLRKYNLKHNFHLVIILKKCNNNHFSKECDEIFYYVKLTHSLLLKYNCQICASY